ncbi:hypothetical protein A2454_04975 [Candidatus Peribacteria bacterium RIFOXYC2_FULL_55_14]|nr:MAG: hypothetical protein UY90_C0045G0004 [Candidatus Peregrinibacteria bacterium GW2011_GWA2_54_9]OGJ72553.1 MAG: hypothetical protein A2198_01900 [Candidatus Peribacteria bacterium RIFOXYA1_FULL_56_14]OGJ73676.1 MAG: hypothetical protein A2217_06140 [Candidatus Peribacteria bacterium RIFOXYA2_FULL_55_28]OGJ75299.1 MAG: hypothetical protein A2384_00125 [Candidatus Peribacteria bacterium RIFOXYB1_FULL_54_35]OGJ76526.1 MAG: hypothetical protein A2327_01755 [Candidatus Peribacteria bacterium R
MKLRSLLATGMLLMLLIPAVSSAARPVVKKYLEVEGPFETEAEAEAACMKAVGIDEESIRFSTGNIGYLWEVDNPLRFLVRRCVNNVKKQKDISRLAGQKEKRQQSRTERIRSSQTQRTIDASNQFIQNRAGDNVRNRVSQQTRGRSENLENYGDIRSLRRADMQTVEREIREKLEKRKDFQKEAEVVCRYRRGAQRIMCIRQEVREREEALYEKKEAEDK